jgi:hypothetical protein
LSFAGNIGIRSGLPISRSMLSAASLLAVRGPRHAIPLRCTQTGLRRMSREADEEVDAFCHGRREG